MSYTDKTEIGSLMYVPGDLLIIVSKVVKTIKHLKRVKSFCDGLPYYDIKVINEKITYYELSRGGVMSHEFLTRKKLDDYTSYLFKTWPHLYREFDPII